MCAHETPQEAARCSCTGYGFGDPPCRCGRPKSQHVNGTGACTDPRARCHEYVLHLDDPFPITLAVVREAAAAIVSDLNTDPMWAQQAALAALFAGRRQAVERDFELRSLRAQVDRMSKYLNKIEQELENARSEGLLDHRDQGPAVGHDA